MFLEEFEFLFCLFIRMKFPVQWPAFIGYFIDEKIYRYSDISR